MKEKLMKLRETNVKKIIAILTIITMILNLMPPVFADSSDLSSITPDNNNKFIYLTTAYDSSDESIQGDWLDNRIMPFDLYMTGNIPVSGFQFCLEYDPAILTPYWYMVSGRPPRQTYTLTEGTSSNSYAIDQTTAPYAQITSSLDTASHVLNIAGAGDDVNPRDETEATNYYANGKLWLARMTFKVADGYTPTTIPTTALSIQPYRTYTTGYKVKFNNGTKEITDTKWVSQVGFVAPRASLSSIALTTLPTKTQYYNGETLDWTGAKLTATYSDDTTEEITVSNGSGTEGAITFGATTASSSSKSVSITYGGKSTTFNYSTLTGISVSTPPTKTTYDHGDSLNFAGAKLTATYTNSSSGTSTSILDIPTQYSAGKITVNRTKADVDNPSVKFSYHGFTADQNLTVNDPLASISVSAPTNTEYNHGETINFAGGYITPKTKSGKTSGTVSLTDASVTKSDTTANIGKATNTWTNSTTNLTAGYQPITVSYTSDGVTKTANFNIVVNDTVSSVAITTQPTATNKYNTETLDFTGTVATVTTAGGKTFTVDADSLSINTSSYNRTLLTKQSFPATYSGKSAGNIEITLLNYVDGVKATFNTTEFDYGTTKNAIALAGTYHEIMADGSTGSEKPLTSSMISGYTQNPAASEFDSNHQDTQILTISLTEDSNTFTDTETIKINDKITTITVKAPTNTEYRYNEDINYAGGTVTPTYASGATGTAVEMADPSVTKSGYNKTTLGNQTVTVTYGEKTGTFTVKVTDYVTGVTVTKPTSAQDGYKYGDALNVNGATITLTYASTATEPVTPSASDVVFNETTTIAKTNASTLSFNATTHKATANVQLTYTENGITGKSDAYEITVTDSVTGLTIKTSPETSYNVNDTLSLANGVATVTRASGSTTDLDMTSDVTVSSVDMSTEGTKTVNVSYTENGETVSTSYNVTVTDTVKSIAVDNNNQPKTTYKYGETLNVSGGKINVTKGSGTTSVAMTTSMVSGYNPNQLGEQTLTVTYGGKTTTYTVTVEDYVKQINVTTNPKTSYNVNDTLDLTNGKLKVTTASGVESEIDMTATGVTVAPADTSLTNSTVTSTAGTKTMNVTYTKEGTTVETTYNITVTDTIKSISMGTTPKTTYKYGEALNVSTGTINVTKGSGTTSVAMTTSMVSGYNPNQLGEQTLTVTYGRDALGNDCTTTYNVTVEDYVSGITLTNPTTTEYSYGEEISYEGGNVTVSWASGKPATQVEMTDPSVTKSGYNKNTLGTQTITVTYGGKSATFTAKVVDYVTAVAVTAPTTGQDAYMRGDSLNMANATITLTYASNATGNVAPTANMVYFTGTSTNATTNATTLTFDETTHKATANVTLKYTNNGHTDSKDYTITITDPITGINVTANPKTSYNVNDTIDLTNGKINVTRQTGSTSEVDMTASGVTVEPSDTSLTNTTVTQNGGTKAMKVSYTENGITKTTTYEITVTDTIKSISMNTTPKTVYNYGESLNVANGKINVTRGSGTTTMNMSTSMVSGYNPNQLGEQTLTVTYGRDALGNDCKTTYNVTVNDYITGITVVQPTKTSYNYGEEIDYAGGTVTPVWASGASADAVAMTEATVTKSGYNKNTLGNQTVTVTYNGKSGTFNATVTDYIASVSVTAPTTSQTYNRSDAGLNMADATITEHYAQAGNRSVTPLASMVTDDATGTTATIKLPTEAFDANHQATRNVTLTYTSENGQTDSKTYTITVIDDVTSIAVTRAPTSNFNVNGDFVEDGEITVTRSSGAQEILTITKEMTDFDSQITSEGTNKPITVTYGGKTTSYNITVQDATSSIELQGTPKTAYKYNEDLDLTGLKIRATKGSGRTSNITVTSAMVSGYDKTALGNQTVTVTYDGFTKTFDVNVKDYVTGITITPTSVNGNYGDTLDTILATPVKYTVNYAKAGDQTALNVTNTMVTTLDSTLAEEQTLTVSYTDNDDNSFTKGQTFTAPLNVTLSDPVTNITITEPTKKEYRYGEDFSLTGASITITRLSGTTSTVTPTADMILQDGTTTPVTTSPDSSNFVTSNTYTEPVTFSYTKEGQTASTSFNVIINDYVRTVDFTKPTKTTYLYGETFTADGASIATVMASGNSKGATYPSAEITVDSSAFDSTTVGVQTIILTYDGNDYTYDVTIKNPAIEIISLDASGAKTEYKYGEEIDPSGLVLTVKRTSGDIEVVDVTPDMISGYDSHQSGDQTVTVTIDGLTATYDVEVGARPAIRDRVVGYTLVPPTKTIYKLDEKLDLTDGELVEQKKSGRTGNSITLTEDMITGFDTTTIGSKEITVEYAGYKFTFNIVVNDGSEDITTTKVTPPTKTVYEEGEELDLTGGKIEIINGKGEVVETIDITPDMVEGFETTTPGSKTVTIKIGEETFTFTITVREKEEEEKEPEEEPAPAPVTPTRPTRPTQPTNTTPTANTTETQEQPKEEEKKDEKLPIIPGTIDNSGKGNNQKPTSSSKSDNTKVTGTTTNKEGLSASNISLMISSVIAALGALYIILLVRKDSKNVKVYIEEDNERKLIGEEKISKNHPELDLNKYYNENQDGEFQIVLDKSISKELDDKVVNVTIHGGKKEKFTVDYHDEAYVYETGVHNAKSGSKWIKVDKK